MDKIEITPQMVTAGVEALKSAVPLDVANPVLAEEDIVRRIYVAMYCAVRCAKLD
jgi:hypothetical protein